MSEAEVVEEIVHRYCQSTKMGYVCQRGEGHRPVDLHAQLVRHTQDGKLLAAMWVDEVAGVVVKKLNPVEAEEKLAHEAGPE